MPSVSDIPQLITTEIDALLQGQSGTPILLERLKADRSLTDSERLLVDRFNQLIEKLTEVKDFAAALGDGHLGCQAPRHNILASPLKQLHTNLRHLTWQAKQVAQGDLSHEVDFLGDFSDSFNSMIQALREKAIAESDLKKSERQYRIIFDKSPLGMAHISPYSEFLLVNPAFLKLVEYSEESILEMDLTSIVPDDHLQNYHEIIQRLFHDEAESLTHELQYLPRNKDPIWVRVNSTIIRDENQRSPYILSIIQDINQQKLLEQQIQDHNRLLERLVESRTAELTAAKDQAEKADRVKSEFLANMSHEMRTPINGIIGIAELGINDEMEGEQAFVGILQESQSLLRLVNGILDLSKIEADQVEIESIPFNLTTILDDLFTFFEPLALRKGINLTIQTKDQLPSRVVGDPLRLRQVLTNLLENAIKFTHEGDITVRVTSLFQDDVHCHLHFMVEDTGIGIPEDQLQNIFREFTQVDGKDTRQYGGTGLGLSIAQRLLQMMGAEVSVASEPGNGSSFSFDIEMDIPSLNGFEPEWTAPMVVATNLELSEVDKHEKAQKIRFEKTESDEDERDRESTDLGPELEEKTRVLVVEDYEANWMILMAHLKHQGYHSELAKNGKEAVDCFRKNHYDLILMDIQMPEMNGLDATKAIREMESERPDHEPGGERVPIIAVTANTTQEDRKNCFDVGMDDFLSKPITRSILFEKIGCWLPVNV